MGQKRAWSIGKALRRPVTRLRPATRLLAAFTLLAVALAACSPPDEDSGVAATQIATAAATSAQATSTTAAPQPTATRPAGSSATPAPTTPAVGTPAPGASPVSSPTTGTTTLSAYFIRNEKIGVAHRGVPQTQQVASAAMQELLNGPSASEKSAGLSTSIPQGTRLLGVVVTNRIASVDLSREFESGGGSFSMAARLAQVVFTLTQFPTIETVEFKINGQKVTTFGGEGLILDHPVGRGNYENLTPAILVETPAIGDTVASPARLQGTANTFEAAFTINIVDGGGKVIAEKHAMATSGSGTRGTFDVSVPFEIGQTGQGKVVVFELSARDGSKINVVEIPVTLRR